MDLENFMSSRKYRTKKMINQPKYHFADSINNYLALNKENKLVRDWYDISQFDPSALNRANYNTVLAYHLAFQTELQYKYQKAIELFEEAKLLYAHEDVAAHHRVRYCQRQIKYLNKRITKLE